MARILVIEDNPANMRLTTLLLQNAGHTALGAVDAESGLTLARAERPDLILMDMQLPGMDGFAATALLKKDPATAAIPVIALTAMAMKRDQENARIAGCDAYVAKVVDRGRDETGRLRCVCRQTAELPGIVCGDQHAPGPAAGAKSGSRGAPTLDHDLSTCPEADPVNLPPSQVTAPFTTVYSMPCERITMRFAPPGRS